MILTATINEVKRRILFDNPQAVVAVKGDYEVNGIAFAFPAIYEDDFDLSTAVKTVYYKATDGIIYNHVVTATDTDTGYPLWVFKDEINKGAFGDVEFALVCDKVEGGNIVKRWVSMITAFRVQKSIEIDESAQEDNEQTYSERLAYLMTQMANMQATVSGLASGAPTAVSLASGMTDTNKLYVYTGSESGYTAGHWYYYNGSAWADGGQYGGTSVDTTLTVSGAAADAKVTGDKIAEIKEDLFNLKEYNVYDIIRDSPYAYENTTRYGVSWQWDAQNKVCTVSGTATQMSRNRFFVDPNSLHSSIVPGRKYYIKYRSTGTAPYLYVAWYANGSLISYKYYNENAEIEVPLNTTGCIIGLQLASGYSANGTVSVQMLSLGQFSDEQFYGIDFAKKYFDFSTVTDNGVSFTWNATKQTCKVSGTATPAVANDVLCEGELPEGMRQGDEFLLRFKLDKIESIAVRVFFFDSNSNQLLDKYSTLHKIGNASADVPFKVPAKSATWRVKIYVPYRASDPISVDATVTRLQLFKTTPRKMEVPLIVSFIDDDTTNDTYVTRFHDSCCHNGIKGNYAVITDRIGDTTSLEKLLQYEDEGFGMLIHAKDQNPTRTPYWTPKDEQGNPRTHTSEELNQCRANLNAGLRKMREDGFVNYNYWVTPGGHHEDGIIEIAKQSGVECMIPTNNGRYNSMQDCNKWVIRRISLSNTTQSGAAEDLQFVKDKIDEAVAAGGGWLIITTHYNDGWSSTDTWDDTLDSNGYPVGYTRFNEIAQYAISAGMVPMSIPQAWEYYRPIIDANHSEYQRDIT